MIWQVDPKSEKHLKEIAKLAKTADEILLATDPDREGEAISWHVIEILKSRSVLKDKKVKRVVFHEITKSAVDYAINHPRELDKNLIEAYLARRSLDYLVGFTISPLLWRKLPGTRSAGRVQSVALRLITDRETEIEDFDSQEYWSILVDFAGKGNKALQTKLTHLDGEKLDKFALGNKKPATEAVTEIEKHTYKVTNVEKKQVKRNPTPPFTTSTLQQEAARKLGFSARRTMRTAQQLYEGINIGGETAGLITYMRTDSVQISTGAREATRDFIKQKYGEKYLPEKPRFYKSKAKNAQEAHEAIRPTDARRQPKDIALYLDDSQKKLYDLIWKRMVASQMESAVLNQVAIDVANQDKQVILRATGSTIEFDGFFKVYREGTDEISETKDQEKMLPPVEVGEDLTIKKIEPNQHFTQPPPRYTEASLVKNLEELGIGRPSTYASIIHTLLDRDYVVLEKKQFHPQNRGRILTAFLLSFFSKYVQFNFTAEMEEKLDNISNGEKDWKDVLAEFWGDFHKAVDEAKSLTITQVIEKLNQDLSHMLFPAQEEGKDPRECPKCKKGKLSLKLGKFGSFMGCSDYPDCDFTRQLQPTSEEVISEEISSKEPKVLGIDPDYNVEVSIRKGPYGYYLQWGEADPKSKEKPKRGSIPKNVDIDELTLEKAILIGSLPRTVGFHPLTGHEITAGIGRFGPYLRHNNKFHSIKADDDVLTIDVKRAVEVIAQTKQSRPKNTKGPKKTSTKKSKS